MKDEQALDQAMQEVDDTKKALDASYAKRRETVGPLGAAPVSQPAEPVLKSWTVKMKDGTVYPGVKATSPEEAARKMMEGPAGILAPPPFSPAPGREMPAPAPRTPAGGANFTGLPEAASGAGILAAGPAIAGAGMASDMLTEKPPAPTTGRDIAGDLVPLAVGALSRPARTLGSATKSVLGNVLGRGAVEGGIAAATGEENPIGAAMSGAAKGVLPGIAQASIGAALGPTTDTLRVEKAAKALKTELSPNLAALIDPAKPATLLSGKTVKALQSAAGTNLDTMEANVERLLGPTFRFQSGGAAAGPLTPSPGEAAIRRGLGLRANEPLPQQWLQGATGMPQSPATGQTFAEMRGQVKKLRELGDKAFGPEASRTAAAAKADARDIERAMVQQMPPEAAKAYEEGIAQHAKDSGAIRWLKDVQKQNAVHGGVNPQDRPGLGTASEAINQQGGSIKAGLHGVLGAAEAMTGRPIGAGYHLGRAADTARAQTGPLKPQQTVPYMTPKIAGGVGGSVTGGLQSLLLKKLQPQASAD